MPKRGLGELPAIEIGNFPITAALPAETITEEPDRRALLHLVPEVGELDSSPGQVRLDRRLYTLLLDIDRQDLLTNLIEPADLSELAAHGFRPKNELHITILAYNNGGQILKNIMTRPDSDKEKALEIVEQESAETDWSWQPTGQVFPFQGRRRGAIKLAALVDCPGANDFYDRLEGVFPGLELERHPMHVTLMKRRGEIAPQEGLRIGGLAIGRPLHTLDGLQQMK